MLGKEDAKILGIGLFLIGLVLIIEALLILALVVGILSVLSPLTFFVGIGYVVFKMAAGVVALIIGAKPFSSKKRRR